MQSCGVHTLQSAAHLPEKSRSRSDSNPRPYLLPVINISVSLLLKDIENIGIMQLHVIPNVCSEYSEQKIQAIGRPYRAIIHSTCSGSSIRFTFDLFSKMSTTRDPKTFCLRVSFLQET